MNTIKSIALAALCTSLASTVLAQERSNLQVAAINELGERNLLTEGCAAKVTSSDAAKINAYKNDSNKTEGNKNSMIKSIATKICGR